MSLSESDVLSIIQLDLSADGSTKLFRNNTGTGWTGSKIIHKSGVVIITHPRPLNAGLCKGSSDLIGFKTVVITPEMVGQKVAVFTAIEGKAAKGRTSEDQLNFIDVVKNAGGFAGVAKSSEDAKAIVAK